MKDRSVIAQYVKTARLSAGLTQDQLAEKLGMTKGNVSGWENDKHHPSPQQLALLARLSGMPLPEELAPTKLLRRANLFDHSAESEDGDPLDGFSDEQIWPDVPAGAYGLRGLHEIPVVGTTQGGPPDRIWEELQHPVGYSDEYLEVATPDPHAYALRVVGSSMAPRIIEGMWLLVEPSDEAQPGDDVVVKTHDGRVMVKNFLSRYNGTVMLGSVNESYERISVELADIEFMHFVGGYFPARRVKRRIGNQITAEEYSGAGRRVNARPSTEERRHYVPPQPITSEGNFPGGFSPPGRKKSR